MTNGMMNWAQLQGLLMMFNGHFHKGVHQYFKAGRAYSKEKKAAKKALEAKEKEAK